MSISKPLSAFGKSSKGNFSDLFRDGCMLKYVLRAANPESPAILRGDVVELEFVVRASSGSKRILSERSAIRCHVGRDVPGFMPKGYANRLLTSMRAGERCVAYVISKHVMNQRMEDAPWIVDGFEWVDEAFEWEVEVQKHESAPEQADLDEWPSAPAPACSPPPAFAPSPAMAPPPASAPPPAIATAPGPLLPAGTEPDPLMVLKQVMKAHGISTTRSTTRRRNRSRSEVAAVPAPAPQKQISFSAARSDSAKAGQWLHVAPLIDEIHRDISANKQKRFFEIATAPEAASLSAAPDPTAVTLATTPAELARQKYHSATEDSMLFEVDAAPAPKALAPSPAPASAPPAVATALAPTPVALASQMDGSVIGHKNLCEVAAVPPPLSQSYDSAITRKDLPEAAAAPALPFAPELVHVPLVATPTETPPASTPQKNASATEQNSPSEVTAVQVPLLQKYDSTTPRENLSEVRAAVAPPLAPAPETPSPLAAASAPPPLASTPQKMSPVTEQKRMAVLASLLQNCDAATKEKIISEVTAVPAGLAPAPPPALAPPPACLPPPAVAIVSTPLPPASAQQKHDSDAMCESVPGSARESASQKPDSTAEGSTRQQKLPEATAVITPPHKQISFSAASSDLGEDGQWLHVVPLLDEMQKDVSANRQQNLSEVAASLTPLPEKCDSGNTSESLFELAEAVAPLPAPEPAPPPVATSPATASPASAPQKMSPVTEEKRMAVLASLLQDCDSATKEKILSEVAAVPAGLAPAPPPALASPPPCSPPPAVGMAPRPLPPAAAQQKHDSATMWKSDLGKAAGSAHQKLDSTTEVLTNYHNNSELNALPAPPQKQISLSAASSDSGKDAQWFHVVPMLDEMRKEISATKQQSLSEVAAADSAIKSESLSEVAAAVVPLPAPEPAPPPVAKSPATASPASVPQKMSPVTEEKRMAVLASLLQDCDSATKEKVLSEVAAVPAGLAPAPPPALASPPPCSPPPAVGMAPRPLPPASAQQKRHFATTCESSPGTNGGVAPQKRDSITEVSAKGSNLSEVAPLLPASQKQINFSDASSDSGNRGQWLHVAPLLDEMRRDISANKQQNLSEVAAALAPVSSAVLDPACEGRTAPVLATPSLVPKKCSTIEQKRISEAAAVLAPMLQKCDSGSKQRIFSEEDAAPAQVAPALLAAPAPPSPSACSPPPVLAMAPTPLAASVQQKQDSAIEAEIHSDAEAVALPPVGLPTLRVLVIGGTQFMGRLMVKTLLDDGHHVTLITRGVSPNPFLGRQNFVAYRCDRVAERDHFRRLLESEPTGWDVAIDFICFQPWVLRDTLEALRRPGGGCCIGHYIFISTDSVYWALKLPAGNKQLTEDQGSRFTCFEWKEHCEYCEETSHGKHQLGYGIAKLEAEDLLQEIGSSCGLPYTILRLPDIYGAYDNLGVFWKLVDLVRNHQPIELGIPSGRLRPGRTLTADQLRFSWASARDVCDFIFSVIKAGAKAHYEIFHVVQAERVSLQETAEMIASILGVAKPCCCSGGEAMYPSTDFGSLDGSKAARLLRWRPSPLLDSIRWAITWYLHSEENRNYSQVCARARDSSVQMSVPREPWNPLQFSLSDLRIFNAEIRRIAADLRSGSNVGHQEWPHAKFWMINLGRGAPEHPVATQRRALMEEVCIAPLRAAGVDAQFFDGCIGVNLPLDHDLLVNGGVQEVTWNGSTYEVDTRSFIGRGNVSSLAVIEQRFFQMDFFPYFWHALRLNHQEPQTPGFVGGYISHVEVWKMALKRNLDWVFIAEDDCMPSQSISEGRSPLTWPDVWRVAAAQVSELQDAGTAWDILYVGRSPSQSRPGPDLHRPPGVNGPPLLVAPGWCMRTQSYCLSRSGIQKLCASGLARRVLHRPQDELLAALSMGGHPQLELWQKICEDGPQGWRALAFRFDGLTCQLQDMEKTERALSFCACSDGLSGVSKDYALNHSLLE